MASATPLKLSATTGKPERFQSGDVVAPAFNNVAYGTANIRLSLSSTLPFPDNNLTAITNVYVWGVGGDKIGLYDGTSWDLYQFSDTTMSLSGKTASRNYDIVCELSSGVPAFSFLQWDTTGGGAGVDSQTRVTHSLVRFNGIYHVTGTNKRYIGTVRTTASTGQSEWSTNRALLWNMYNRADSYVYSQESTNSANYTLTTPRELFAGTTVGNSRVEVLIGLDENVVYVDVKISATTTVNNNLSTGVGIDNNTNVAKKFGTPIGASQFVPICGNYEGKLGLGFHSVRHLHWVGTATGTATWYGDNNLPAAVQAGMDVKLFQ